MKYLTLLLFPVLFLLSSCIKGPQGPAGPSEADELTDPSVKPKVIWTFPENGQTGPISNFNESISIRFNKIMDISTVNKSLQLSPQSGYARIDTTEENSFPTGDLIFIDIQSDSSYRWNIGQTYTLTVATTLKDINGNSLQSPYVLSFTPEPYFRVTYTYPNNAATNVSRNNEIELWFNNTINYSTFLSSISISPPVSGSWNYYGENLYKLIESVRTQSQHCVCRNTRYGNA